MYDVQNEQWSLQKAIWCNSKTSVGVLPKTFWHFRNNKSLLQSRRKRNCELKASGLEQMAELRKIWFLCFCLKWCGVRSGTDGLCAGELHQAGPNGWCGVWVDCDRWCYQCDMCPPVLRYLHFSAHTITSPVLSIVRKDKATGWPDISQYLNFRYQTDSDECQWQLAEICPVCLATMKYNWKYQMVAGTHALVIKTEY